MMGRTKQKYPDTHRRNRPDNHVENEDDSPNDEDSLENGVVVVDPIQNRQKSSNNNHNHTTWTLYGIVSLVLLIGTSAATAFLAIGIGSENHDMESQFEEATSDIVDAIQTAWESYVSAASMIHYYCRNRNFSRDDFRGLYEYLLENGLPFQVAEFAPNITNAERPVFEAEAKAFYMEQYPHFNYSGFLGFNTDNSTQLLPRERADFYFPAHYVEPIRSNEPIIGFDLYSSDSRRRTIDTCLKTGKPALTDRLTFEPEQAMGTYEVALMHPGINISVHKGQRWPRDLASIVICIHDILLHSAEKHRKWRHQIYIYDPSDWRNGEPVFLGAADVNPPRPEQTRRTTTSITRSRKLHVAADTAVTPLPEVPMQVALTGSYRAQTIDAADKQWIVIVRQVEGTFEPNHVFVILGGVIIFGASVCLAAWIFKSTKEERSHVQTEKAALILEAAQCTARRERELNDFIAHEVRNPVAAAMAACNFVKSTIYKEQPFPTREALEITREDVGTIDNALVFVNDLLRDMLDMHRASNNQLVVKLAPTDVRHDILEPVDGILYQRGGDMKVYVECPNNLVVNADRLRLKQVLLNLGRNSAKFVEDGFVKLRTEIDPCGMVQLLVEDSGPGIPPEKRDQLFNKYQESLDRLSQGTVRMIFPKQLLKTILWLQNEFLIGTTLYLFVFPGNRVVSLSKFSRAHGWGDLARR
jgi:signal transduction histidine kinase